MAVHEIDSFIQKFKDLWKCGFDAHLDIDTHAGQAWVGLRVGLGVHGHQAWPSQEAKMSGPRDSPCKQRRRARRDESRKVKAEEAAKESDVTEGDLVTHIYIFIY